MIRIEYDSTSNPNYVNTKWVEESDSYSAMLGRLHLPIWVFNIFTKFLSNENFTLIEKKNV